MAHKHYEDLPSESQIDAVGTLLIGGCLGVLTVIGYLAYLAYQLIGGLYV